MIKIEWMANWNTLDLRQQKLLLSLYPFVQYVYYDYRNYIEYLRPLKTYLGDVEGINDLFYSLIEQGVSFGWFVQVSEQYAFLKIHPFFKLWLNKQLQVEHYQAFKQALTHAFLDYTYVTAEEMYGRFRSGDPAFFEEALEIMEYEHQSLMQATQWSLQSDYSISLFLSAIRPYFFFYQSWGKWLNFVLGLEEKLEKGAINGKSLDQIVLYDVIGNVQLELRQSEKAIKYFKKAIEACQKLDQSDELVQRMLGAAYTNLGNIVSSRQVQIEYQEKALALARKHQNSKQIGRIAYNLSEAHFELRDLKQSWAYLKEALGLFELDGTFEDRIKALQSVAAHYQLDEKWKDAEDILQKALQLAENFRDITLQGVLHQELASLYYNSSQIARAEISCQQAINRFIQAGDVRQTGNAYNLMSVIAFANQDLEVGYDYAEKAIACFYQVDDPAQMAQTYVNLAITTYREGLYEVALPEIQKGIPLYQSNGYDFLAHQARILLGSIHLALNNLSQAKSECLTALQYFEKASAAKEIQDALAVARAVYKVSRDEQFREAIQTFSNSPS